MNVSGISTSNPALQVGSVSDVSTTTGASRAGGPGSENRMQAAVGAAAQLFGMSAQQLQSSLASGQSMASIAASKGISSSDLTNALTQALASAVPQGATPPSSTMLQKIASNIANHVGSVQHTGHHHHHHRGGGASVTAATSTTPGATPGSAGTGSVDTYA